MAEQPSFGESCQVRRHGRGFGWNSVLTTSFQGSGAGVGCQQALLLSDPICYWVMQTHRVPCTALLNAACNGGVNTSFVATWPWIQTWLRQASPYLRLEDTSDFKVWVFLPLRGKKPHYSYLPWLLIVWNLTSTQDYTYYSYLIISAKVWISCGIIPQQENLTGYRVSVIMNIRVRTKEIRSAKCQWQLLASRSASCSRLEHHSEEVLEDSLTRLTWWCRRHKTSLGNFPLVTFKEELLACVYVIEFKKFYRAHKRLNDNPHKDMSWPPEPANVALTWIKTLWM